MLQKFNLTWEAEVPDKTSQYRVWTSKNFLLYKAGTALQSLEELPQDYENHSDLWSLVPSKGMDSPNPDGDLLVNNKLLLEAASLDEPVGHNLQNSFDSSAVVSQSVNEGMMIYICRFIALILHAKIAVACSNFLALMHSNKFM